MMLTILGSGTCVPSLKRNASGYLLEAGGKKVLIDCGSGILLQLERAGASYRDIDALFLTHGHPDHFADVMPLLHGLYYTPGFTRQKSLHIFAPEEFRQYFTSAILSVLGHPESFDILFASAENVFTFKPWIVKTAGTEHSAGSIAYRFEFQGKSLVFTGDADYDEHIVSLSKGSDILIADCSFPDSMKVKGHLSAGECGRLAKNAGVKKLVLSHIYPTDTPEENRVIEAREHFPGDVILAEDLMKLDI